MRVEVIAQVRFNIYADDVILWCCRSSSGHQEGQLLEKIAIVPVYMQEVDLSFPRLKPYLGEDRRYSTVRSRNLTELTLDGAPIARKEETPVFGLWLHQQSEAGTWVRNSLTQVNQITQMIQRISRKLQRVKERELHRISEVLIVPVWRRAANILVLLCGRLYAWIVGYGLPSVEPR